MATRLEARRIWNEVISRPNVDIQRVGREYSFAFDNAKRRTGVTKFVDRKIALSNAYLPGMTLFQVEQTILHEIAHAIVGFEAGHGPHWKRTAFSIGYQGGREAEKSIKLVIEPLWKGTVPCCPKIKVTAHRLTDKKKRLQCNAHRHPVIWKATR